MPMTLVSREQALEAQPTSSLSSDVMGPRRPYQRCRSRTLPRILRRVAGFLAPNWSFILLRLPALVALSVAVLSGWMSCVESDEIEGATGLAYASREVSSSPVPLGRTWICR